MLERSDDSGVGSPLTLAALLDRHPRKSGAPRIRQILGLRDESPRRTRSDPESALLHPCDDDRIRDRVLATIGIRTVRATAFDLGAGAAAFAADLKLLRGEAA